MEERRGRGRGRRKGRKGRKGMIGSEAIILNIQKNKIYQIRYVISLGVSKRFLVLLV